MLIKRIPYNNIYGYDFDSDWSDKGEPVFYTRYKGSSWKLYADDLEVIDIDNEYRIDRIELKKTKTHVAHLIILAQNQSGGKLSLSGTAGCKKATCKSYAKAIKKMLPPSLRQSHPHLPKIVSVLI